MKRNGEFERIDLAADPDIQISDDGRKIEFYLETWFDVDAKFGTDTRYDDDAWINLYAVYDPYTQALEVMYIIDRPDDAEVHAYEPTKGEADLIVQLLNEKIYELYKETPLEFCEFAA